MISASSVIDTTQLSLNNVIELLFARRPATVNTSVFFIVSCFSERAEFTTLFWTGLVEVAERTSSIVIVPPVEIDILPEPRSVSPFIVLIVVPDVRIFCFFAISVSTYDLLTASLSSLGVFTLRVLENVTPSALGDIVTSLAPSLSSILLIAFNSAVLKFIY